ncbi:mitochondrial ribosomal protein subunit l11 [Gigaspora margarita]|uniref:Mitochondrial ribosomal protein subunit l11 n=1 Tax=Gigaspora margarita TaxID=4874 RepID=A0A8H4A957_GIGMA|nr:mitochondrial ribosomal protein subunit l11 [Gigaspora margarita]
MNFKKKDSTATHTSPSTSPSPPSIKSKNTSPPHAPQQSKTRYGNEFPLHTVYLFNLYYEQLHFNRLFFIVQHNNLNVQEQIIIRRDLKYLGADITMIRGSVLNAVIRQSVIYQNLAPLIVGPVAMISSNVSEEKNPKLVSDILNIINKQKKLLLMGGKLDSSLLNVEDIERMAKLPNKKQLQTEIVGLLSAPAARIIEILNRNPQSLVRSLELHKANLDKKS